MHEEIGASEHGGGAAEDRAHARPSLRVRAHGSEVEPARFRDRPEFGKRSRVAADDENASTLSSEPEGDGATQAVRSAHDERGSAAEPRSDGLDRCAAHKVCYYKPLRRQVNRTP